MNPTRIAIRRPVTMLMAVLALILTGIISYTELPVQELPNVTFPFVVVTVSYPGTTPLDMENQVTIPLENAMSGVNGISQMNGTSSQGLSRVSVQFAIGTDVNIAANDISQAVSRISGQLPSGIQTPTIFKANPNSSPIMNLTLTGSSPENLYDTATNIMQPALEQVAGVASVQVQGGLVRQVNVTVNPGKLQAYGVSLSQISQTIASQNESIPGGTTTEGNQVKSVSTDAYYQTSQDLRNLVISSRPGGMPLTLQQVADVQEGYAPVNQVTHFNGADAVGLSITAQSGANIVAVDQAVKQKLATMEHTLPAGMKTAVVNDATVFTRESIQAVEDDLVLAVLLPALVLLLFLHRIRNTLIVVLAIPTSLISTFTVMFFLGFSLDLISLLALSLLTGILVDDSIVVLENINRHLGMGKSPLQAALDGRMEIGLAAVAITMTDIVVYLPIAFTSGLIGQIFREFGLTIVAATLFSLFVSFTVTPLLASRWLKESDDEEKLAARTGGGLWQRFTSAWERNYGRLRNGYGRLIGAALRIRPLVILIGVGALALSVSFIPLGWLGTEFTPQEDNSQFSVSVNFPNGTPLQQTEQVVFTLDNEIRSMPGVLQSYVTAGARGGFFGAAGTNSGQISVDLVPVGQRAPITDYLTKVRALGQTLTRQYPGASIVTRLQSSLGPGGGGGFVQVVFQGPDINVLNQLAAQATSVIQKVPGVVDVRNEASQTVPELAVQIDRAKAAEYGVTADQIGSAVRTSVAGVTASNLRPSGSTIQTPIVLQVAGGNIMDRNQIAQIPLVTSSGSTIQLSQVAQVVPSSQPAQLSDQNRLLEVTVSANTAGAPIGQVTPEIQKAMASVQMPNGYFFTFGGAAQQQSQAFGPLFAAFGLSILFIYMLTSSLYESFLYPLAVILSLPLATVGALGALTLTGNTLNLYSFMGLIMLMGLVAKNAILLVDYTNTLRERGYARLEALREAGRTRLRPILMTTATMTFAMLPLAVKIGAGSEDRSPMATVLVGGLLTSTLLTLVFVPVVYSYLDDFGELLGRVGLMSRRQWGAAEAGALAIQAGDGDLPMGGGSENGGTDTARQDTHGTDGPERQ
ncbi:MAG: efflux RND transporter permease subunit [Bacteroidetes bacterium]|nr:efflux RND transporter permease subunit [Bacteroidota bacterium]